MCIGSDGCLRLPLGVPLDRFPLTALWHPFDLASVWLGVPLASCRSGIPPAYLRHSSDIPCCFCVLRFRRGTMYTAKGSDGVPLAFPLAFRWGRSGVSLWHLPLASPSGISLWHLPLAFRWRSFGVSLWYLPLASLWCALYRWIMRIAKGSGLASRWRPLWHPLWRPAVASPLASLWLWRAFGVPCCFCVVGVEQRALLRGVGWRPWRLGGVPLASPLAASLASPLAASRAFL